MSDEQELSKLLSPKHQTDKEVYKNEYQHTHKIKYENSQSVFVVQSNREYIAYCRTKRDADKVAMKVARNIAAKFNVQSTGKSCIIEHDPEYKCIDVTLIEKGMWPFFEEDYLVVATIGIHEVELVTLGE